MPASNWPARALADPDDLRRERAAPLAGRASALVPRGFSGRDSHDGVCLKVRRSWVPVLVSGLALGLGLAACSSGSGSGGSSGASPGSTVLSMSTVKVAGYEGSVNWASLWAAQAEGYFKQQGLTVDFVNTQASASSMVAAAIGNSYQFIATDPVGLPAAIQNGAEVRSILTTDVGATDDLALSQKAAAAHGIPTTGTAAQLKALKGSHLTIGVVSTSAGSYLDLLAVLKTQGVTAGTGSNTDLKIESVGSLSDEAAGLAAGHLDGIVNIYPNTELPNTVHIMYGSTSPVSLEPPLTITTSEGLITSHPDTVQAFVTAVAEGWQYTKEHPTQAEAISAAQFPQFGITDPAKITTLFDLDQQHRSPTPAITAAEYSAIEQVLQAAGTPTTVAYSGFADSSFINKAITQLKLNVPLGPAAG
jgi:ABC-type nitrate/sulfonate/bicarbonate transport system substrate-binding protein